MQVYVVVKPEGDGSDLWSEDPVAVFTNPSTTLWRAFCIMTSHETPTLRMCRLALWC